MNCSSLEIPAKGKPAKHCFAGLTLAALAEIAFSVVASGTDDY
jgi:hypothetical protein